MQISFYSDFSGYLKHYVEFGPKAIQQDVCLNVDFNHKFSSLLVYAILDKAGIYSNLRFE